jgi:hypothetical protein
VIIGNLDLFGISLVPNKANTVRIVDSNAMLTRAIASQPLQTIARWHGKINEIAHAIKLIEFSASSRPKFCR